MHFSEKMEEFREAKPLGNSSCDLWYAQFPEAIWCCWNSNDALDTIRLAAVSITYERAEASQTIAALVGSNCWIRCAYFSLTNAFCDQESIYTKKEESCQILLSPSSR